MDSPPAQPARVRVWIVRAAGGDAEAVEGRITAACQPAPPGAARPALHRLELPPPLEVRAPHAQARSTGASAHAIDLSSTRWEPLGSNGSGGTKGVAAQPDGGGRPVDPVWGAHDLEGPADVVGRRVRVWRSYTRTFYECLVTDFYPAAGEGLARHRVEFDDGEVELINMHKKKWHLAAHEASAVAAAVERRQAGEATTATPDALTLPPPPPADCAAPLALMHHRPHSGGAYPANGGNGSAPQHAKAQQVQTTAATTARQQAASPAECSGGSSAPASPEVVICGEGAAGDETEPPRRKRGRPRKAPQPAQEAQPGAKGSGSPQPEAEGEGGLSKRARSEPRPADQESRPGSGQRGSSCSGAGNSNGDGGGGGKEISMTFELGTKSFQADGRLTLPAPFMREAFPALQLHLQRLPLSVVARLEDSGGGSTSTHTADGVTTVRLSGACRSYELMGCRHMVERIGPTWVTAIRAATGGSGLEVWLQQRGQKPAQAAARSGKAEAAVPAGKEAASPPNALAILAECAEHEVGDPEAAPTSRPIAAGKSTPAAVTKAAAATASAGSAGQLAVSGCAPLAPPTPDELQWLSQLADGRLPAEELSSSDGVRLLAAPAGSPAAPRRFLLLVQLGVGAESSSIAVRLAGSSSLVLSYTCNGSAGGGSGSGARGRAAALQRELVVVLPRTALSGARPAARALLDGASGRLAVLLAPEA